MSHSNLLARLTDVTPSLSKELRKAAIYLLENKNAIGVYSMRTMATRAGVHPNTLIRLARKMEFTSYENFRYPFRNAMLQGDWENYPQRVKHLQHYAKSGKHCDLYQNMTKIFTEHLFQMFSENEEQHLKAVAQAILKARTTYVLGVGVANAVVKNFSYLANMIVDNVISLPYDGSLPVDGLAHVEEGNLLIAMTFSPYRREVVEAVELARSQKLTLVCISDSLASPIFPQAAYRFVIPMNQDLWFTSTVSLSAWMETLLNFIASEAGDEAIASIKKFHTRRHALGVYWNQKEN